MLNYNSEPLLNIPNLYPFTSSFFCHELKLVIEVDGTSHDLYYIQENDAIKEQRLAEYGITVLRFPDVDVFTNIDSVLEQIEDYIEEFESEAG